MTGSARVGAVHQPVTDVAAASRFYAQALGLEQTFADGDRYAAMDGGSVRVALVGIEESAGLSGSAPAFRVDDVHAALAGVVAAGGRSLVAAHDGPHETRAVAADPWGNAFVLYASTPTAAS